MLRVAAIEPNAVTLTTANVSLRRFEQRPGEALVLGQVLDTRVRVNDPELPQLADTDVVITDLGIEQTRTRDWMVTRVAVRIPRRLGRRGAAHIVDWHNVVGLTPSALAMPGRRWRSCCNSSKGCGRWRWPMPSGNYRPSGATKWSTPLTTTGWPTSCKSCQKTTRPTCCSSWAPNARRMCWRRWTPTTPQTCSAQ
ncbi:putative transport transmembrane protein [Mycobacterium xenopi 4042]|uniref:Putative transport transmembrane protein n=1 Tax=Mycobacterium xenopi 4042 TaxID=1299334 RepID=X8E0A6_MYCXE|nr:putative transport transmembrane protein [Mycobacterium xenopi 4042]